MQSERLDEHEMSQMLDDEIAAGKRVAQPIRPPSAPDASSTDTGGLATATNLPVPNA